MFHQIFIELLLGAKYCTMYMLWLGMTMTGPVLKGLVSAGGVSVMHKPNLKMVCVRCGLPRHCGLAQDLLLSRCHRGNFTSELNLIGDSGRRKVTEG